MTGGPRIGGLLAALLVLSGWAAPARSIELLGLYQARAVVTGTGAPNREIGLAITLEDVLVKVSGDARLVGDPRVAALAKDAASLVDSFTYRDRMSGTLIHDEQGSYDRPQDLTVTYDKAKIDAALAGLGLEPWTDPRPTLVVFLSVENGGRRFVLSSDDPGGGDMRDAFDAASFRLSVPVRLPSTATLAEAGLSADALAAADPAKLAAIAKTVGGDQAIAGGLVFSDQAHGWLTTWRMESGGSTYEWRERGVNFDEAFLNAVRGAAQVLAGHGAPN